eukprot:1159646-Pelagomonas_calceolata.AAC.1
MQPYGHGTAIRAAFLHGLSFLLFPKVITLSRQRGIVRKCSRKWAGNFLEENGPVTGPPNNWLTQSNPWVCKPVPVGWLVT